MRDCPKCGGTLYGDGYTTPIHCEFVDIGDMVLECDANPVYCDFDEDNREEI
jgi:hypothetical protein